jgi:pyruvate kinase
MRNTKIVATIGPATSSRGSIESIINAGMDVARMNFSHGTADEHRERVKIVRAVAERLDRAVACMQDLSGPKMRTGTLESPEGVFLEEGAHFILTVEECPGDAARVSTSYKYLPLDVKSGDRILLDDGRIEVNVQKVEGDDVGTEVVHGGVLKSNKGINLPGVKHSMGALTEKDRRDVLTGLEIDIDFIAMSFVRTKDDIEQLRKLLEENGHGDMHIIAKIENAAAVDNLGEILEVADGVMVARGDLGVELPPETVPTVQKEIIQEANKRGRPVITATQMLESMVGSSVPTRAEASDVANAILDGTDAIMLSAETATGKYPIAAVETMSRIAKHTEKYIVRNPIRMRQTDIPWLDDGPVTRAIALAARRAAEELNARYIVAFTESGATVRLVSYARPQSHILGFTPSEQVYRRMAMRWGVTPIHGEHFETTDEMLEVAMRFLKRKGFVEPGDIVVTVCGHTTLAGATDMMKVMKF